MYDRKHKARKQKVLYKRVADEGGLAGWKSISPVNFDLNYTLGQIPSIARYGCFPSSNGFLSPEDEYRFAQQRALMFDGSRDNCVQIAEQLTFWDAVLFKELRLHQCQGAIWGKRHKAHVDTVFSVRATIDQA